MTVAFLIRQYSGDDEQALISLWQGCGLIVPWNDPRADIQRKVADSAALFFVGQIGARLVASCMAGYDGHRGWINYLAVLPAYRHRGIARLMMQEAEKALRAAGRRDHEIWSRMEMTHVPMACLHRITRQDRRTDSQT